VFRRILRGTGVCVGCISCQKRLRLSLEVDECKPLSSERRIALHGRAVKVDPINITLNAPGIERLIPKYDEILSILLKFAFKFNLRRFTTAHRRAVQRRDRNGPFLRHVSPGQELTLVHFSA